MRTKLISIAAVVLVGFLVATNPVVADAAGQITGKQIKNNSVTGKDIKKDSVTGADVAEATLGTVPSATAAGTAASATTAGSADGLTNLPAGRSQSGAFSAAAGEGGNAGWLGFSITYPRALTTAIADAKIIDTAVNPSPAVCPGAGQAAPGYLCLYFQYHQGVGTAYGYSTDAPYNAAALGRSVGVGLYVPVTGSTPYVNGVWTVTAG